VETGDESRDELADDFFRRLTARQRAMLEILVDDRGRMTEPEIR
jgi:hypothetical protein